MPDPTIIMGLPSILIDVPSHDNLQVCKEVNTMREFATLAASTFREATYVRSASHLRDEQHFSTCTNFASTLLKSCYMH